jgi:glycosyltransferase involved in cell wall biosynthesis
MKISQNGLSEVVRPRVSAVIPTIGRYTLRRAISSALEQSYPPHEVIVVNDSAAQAPLLDDLDNVREVFTGGLTGIGAARNTGIDAATGDFVAHLDDDDIWLPSHLSNAMLAFAQDPSLEIYTSSALTACPNETRVVPRVRYRGRQSLIDFFYGRGVWAKRQRVIPCTTWVFPRRLGEEVRMDSKLTDRMDVWWLLCQAELGRKIVQYPHIATVWYQDAQRTASRQHRDVSVDWAKRLEQLKAGAGGRFLVSVVGRRTVRQRRLDEWEQLWRNDRELIDRDLESKLPARLLAVGIAARRAL